MNTRTLSTLLIASCCAMAFQATAGVVQADAAGPGPYQLYWTCEVLDSDGVQFRTLWVDAPTRLVAIAKADAHARAYLDGHVLDCR